MKNLSLASISVALSLFISREANAQNAPFNTPVIPANPYAAEHLILSPVVVPQLVTPVVLAAPVTPWRSPARASFGRFVLESLVGGAVGILAGSAVYAAMCGSQPCARGALAALGTDFAVTPLAVWGLGNLTGGDGALGWTYAGAVSGFAPIGANPSEPANLAMSILIGTIVMPFAAAAAYEATSHANALATEERTNRITVRPLASTINGPDGSLQGGMLGAQGTF